jgi:hypothetical protein
MSIEEFYRLIFSLKIWLEGLNQTKVLQSLIVIGESSFRFVIRPSSIYIPYFIGGSLSSIAALMRST